MSSLLFYTDSDCAQIATDTLVANREGEALGYVQKAIFLPSANVIVAGTGLALMYDRWTTLVNHQRLAFDVDSLDAHTTKALQHLWAEIEREGTSLADYTATIYHFGFSGEDGVIHTFAYRSENGFASEALRYGLAMKPPLKSLDGVDYASFPSSSVEIMLAQRSQERANPESIIRIGGEAWLLELDREGCRSRFIGTLGPDEN